VFFADPAANRIYRADSRGKVSEFRGDTGGAATIAVGPDASVYAAQPARRRIVAYSASGPERVIAQNLDATGLAIRSDGGVYFSDTKLGTIGYIAAGGKPRVVYQGGEMTA